MTIGKRTNPNLAISWWNSQASDSKQACFIADQLPLRIEVLKRFAPAFSSETRLLIADVTKSGFFRDFHRSGGNLRQLVVLLFSFPSLSRHPCNTNAARKKRAPAMPKRTWQGATLCGATNEFSPIDYGSTESRPTNSFTKCPRHGVFL